MPAFVKDALLQHDVQDDYAARPAYQRNDYLGWILRAKKETTRYKRLEHMLRELQQGGVYMGMQHNASKRTTPKYRP